jgi:hypothetical protein
MSWKVKGECVGTLMLEKPQPRISELQAVRKLGFDLVGFLPTGCNSSEKDRENMAEDRQAESESLTSRLAAGQP